MPLKNRKYLIKKQKKNISLGIVYINSTFNNTIITITDMKGNAITWSSAGTVGFKGARKGTPFAAQITAETVYAAAIEHGLNSVHVIIKGPGPGRETSVRTLKRRGLKVLSIKDATSVPHNGCRPPKRRRV